MNGRELPTFEDLPEQIAARKERLKEWIDSFDIKLYPYQPGLQEFLRHLSVLFSALGLALAVTASLAGLLVDSAELQVVPLLRFDSTQDRILALMLFGAVFLIGRWFGLYLLRRTLSQRAHRFPHTSLEEYAAFYEHPEPSKTINLLVWRGYEALSFLLGLKLFSKDSAHSVAVLVHPYEGPEALSLLSGNPTGFSRLAIRTGVESQAPDFMALDIELFQALQHKLLPSVPNLVPVEVDREVSSSMPQELLQLFMNEEELLAIPLMYDVNSIAWNVRKRGEGFAQDASRLLHQPNLHLPINCQLGIVDWCLPILGLFALGIKPEAPFSLNVREFQQLRKLTEEFNQQLKDRNVEFAFLPPELLAVQLQTGEVEVAIGGGSWTAGGAKNETPPVAWVPTTYGAILWCEALVRFDSTQRKPSSSLGSTQVEVITSHFVEKEAQSALVANRLCSGISITLGRSVDGVIAFDQKFEKASPANIILRGLKSGFVRPRTYPPIESSADLATLADWQQLWADWKEDRF